NLDPHLDGIAVGEFGNLGALGKRLILLFFELLDDVHLSIRSDLVKVAFRREVPDRPVLVARSCVSCWLPEMRSERAARGDLFASPAAGAAKPPAGAGLAQP